VHEFSAELVVRRRDEAAEGVVALDLSDPDGNDRPEWEPGAHIDLMLGEGLIRRCGRRTSMATSLFNRFSQSLRRAPWCTAAAQSGS
jgi:ferredoxin-NADP reductase